MESSRKLGDFYYGVSVWRRASWKGGGVEAEMKVMKYLKGFLPWQCEFDHRYACWASNHRGWQKMKKMNKRIAKRRERRWWKKEV